MLHRTLMSAREFASKNSFASWQTWVVHKVMISGVEHFRTYLFDSTVHSCKRCRHANRKTRRIACTGKVCEICGNPFGASTRKYRTKDRSGKWIETSSWFGSMKLH